MTTNGSLSQAIISINPNIVSSIPISNPVHVVTSASEYLQFAEELRQAMPSKIIGQFLAQNVPSSNPSP